MIYLASPYSHPDATVRQERYEAACTATAALLLEGEFVFSPIVHSHPLTQHGLPSDWQFWERHARWHLERCDELVVLQLDGWQDSVGLCAEVELAAELGKPVRYVSQVF